MAFQQGAIQLTFLALSGHVMNSGLLTGTSLSPEDRLKLHQLVHGPKEREGDGLDSSREQYKSYKEGYVMNMQFDPRKSNPS